jgi:iron complex outermembrane receptor protein
MPSHLRASRPPSRAVRPPLHLLCFSITAALLDSLPAAAQTALPGLVIEQPKPAPQSKPRRAARQVPQAAAPVSAPATPAAAMATEPQPSGFPGGQARSGALSVATTQEAIRELATVPGAVTVVTDDYKDTTPAKTIKDALDYVPGVFVQPKWGDDTRLSVRGSGLSRNFHLRGLNLYMDGIPINTADGFGDFQELDPSAFRYIEVYKGASGQRFGATTLGGAINFVTPSGYDAELFGASVDIGSFGFHRLQSSSGGVSGPVDYFITGSVQEQDGFRDHSSGDAERVHANLGYRLSPNVETRFYLNANRVRQDIPGAVSREAALTDPEAAAPNNVTNDQERNIDTLRFANKTTMQVAPGTVLEVGAFALDRHLMHPIFQWLDYEYFDYGGFARLMNETEIGGHKNRLLIAANLHNGTTDVRQYQNIGGEKGLLTADADNEARNATLYAENAFYVLPKLALVAGAQLLHAERKVEDHFLTEPDATPDDSGEQTFNAVSPKVGLLWELDPTAQAYANIARSAEAPSFGENTVGTAPFQADLQTAITYEIGTRGRRPNYSWDVALYRAELENELLCLDVAGTGTCSVRNADETVHQGIELGFGVSVLKGILADGDRPDRLWLNVAYTYSDFRYDGDATFGDNDLPGAPHHFLRAELLYKHPSGVFFGPNIEWVPEAYYVDSANTTKTEAYILLGLKGGYDAGNGLSLYVEGRNLTDEAYIASVSIADNATPDSALFEPGTGRAVHAGVKYRW